MLFSCYFLSFGTSSLELLVIDWYPPLQSRGMNKIISTKNLAGNEPNLSPKYP